MELQSIKLELIKMLLEIDEPGILEKVKNLLAPKKGVKKDAETAVGFRAGGQPITQEQLLLDIQISMEQVKKGEVVSHEDLLKEAENW